MLVLAALSPACGHALQLTGVLLYSADGEGQPVGPVWHTASGLGGRALGFTRWPPPQTRGIPFPQAADGTLSIDLWPAPLVSAHVSHLFWQYLPGEFPAAVVLNLYFNGDNINPGISAWIPWRYGFTHHRTNPSPSTLSLTLDVVDNPQSLEFRDGQLHALLTAAFFFPSSGEPKQWRPRDFTDIDRVGTETLTPDGRPDGVLIFELKVEPDPAAAAPRWTPPWAAARRAPAESLPLSVRSLERLDTPTLPLPTLPVKPSPTPEPPGASTAPASVENASEPSAVPESPADSEAQALTPTTAAPTTGARSPTGTPRRTPTRETTATPPRVGPPTPLPTTAVPATRGAGTQRNAGTAPPTAMQGIPAPSPTPASWWRRWLARWWGS